jgi:chromosomal replication initiation ATPase DnaA
MHDFRMLEVICEIVAKSAQLKSSKPLYSNSRAPAFVKLRDTALFLIRSKTQLSFAPAPRADKRARTLLDLHSGSA